MGFSPRTPVSDCRACAGCSSAAPAGGSRLGPRAEPRRGINPPAIRRKAVQMGWETRASPDPVSRAGPLLFSAPSAPLRLANRILLRVDLDQVRDRADGEERQVGGVNAPF